MTSAKLTTFVPPRPSPRLMRVVDAFNRRLLLSGIPLLRDSPFFKKFPLISGVAKVQRLDFIPEEEAALKKLLSSGNASFVAANHPEFFTDWVLDRELAARFAPDMALWMPPQLVNGSFQKFWLKNNYVASLTGPDANPAKVYSLEWALKGKSVLLHPEFQSGWHGQEISPIYPSVAEMALRAQLTLERQKSEKAAYIVPVVWKLRFLQDEDDALHQEVDYVEQKLGLKKNGSEKLERRVYGLVEQLLEQEELKCSIQPVYKKTFNERWEHLYAHCLKLIFEKDVEKFSAVSPDIAVRHAQRRIQIPSHLSPVLIAFIWLARFSPRYYDKEHMTQEQLAEIIKRVRQDHCEGAWVDKVNQVLPSPVGPRVAYFAIAPAISMTEFRKANSLKSLEKAKEDLTRTLRARMQSALDDLNKRVTEHSGYVIYPNPFNSPSVWDRTDDIPIGDEASIEATDLADLMASADIES